MLPAQTKKTIKKLFKIILPGTLALVMALVIGHGMSTGARAQSLSQLDLTAIPPRIGEDGDLTIKPGEKKQVSLRVKNNSDEVIQIITQAEDFIIGEDGKTPVPVDVGVSNRWSLTSWLTITPNSQLVQPGQTAGINVLIQVPEDALPGGHYAMITHQPDYGNAGLLNAEDGGSASGIKQRVGSLLYVIVEGPINEEALIRDFAFPDFTEIGPVPYSFVVENMSDVHIRPKLNLEIYNMFGRRVDSIQPEAKNIFPLTHRDFSGSWERIWGYGYYTAKLTMSYGQNGQVAMAKTSFWLFPLKLAITVLVLVLALIAGWIAMRRHMIHRKTDQQAEIDSLRQKVNELESKNLKDLED